MAAAIEFPVFIETNLGTHIAMSISADTTAGDLKRKLRREHYICFPHLGGIRINALMVKRRLCFYHLPDSLPVENAFQGLKGTWFLHMDGTCLESIQNEDTLTNGLVARSEKDYHNPDTRGDCHKNSLTPNPALQKFRSGNKSAVHRVNDDKLINPLDDFTKVVVYKGPDSPVVKVGYSTPNISNLTESEMPQICNNSMICTNGIMKGDDSVCPRYLFEKPAEPICIARKRKKKRLVRQNYSKDAMDAAAENMKMETHNSTKEISKGEAVENSDPVENNLVEANLTQDESLGINVSEMNSSSAHPLKSETNSSKKTFQMQKVDSEVSPEIPKGFDNDQKDNRNSHCQRKLRKRVKLHVERTSESNSMFNKELGNVRPENHKSYKSRHRTRLIPLEGERLLSVSQEDRHVSARKHFDYCGSEKESIHQEEKTSHSRGDSPSGSSSEVISVTGVITRYFSEFSELCPSNGNGENIGGNLGSPAQSKEIQNIGEIQYTENADYTSTPRELTVKRTRHKKSKKERNTKIHYDASYGYSTHHGHQDELHKAKVDNFCSRMPVDDNNTPHPGIKDLPSMRCCQLLTSPSSEGPRSKYGRTEVSKRLLTAVNELGLSLSNKKPLVSVCRSVVASGSPVGKRTFEISDGDS